MSSPELLLLGGPPWSGKTSIAKSAVDQKQDKDYGHLSIGDLKRSITSGERESKFKDLLEQRTNLSKYHAVINKDAVLGIFEEYLEEHGNSLTIVDGFPRYPDRLAPFKTSVKKMGAKVIAFCEVKIERAVLLERSKIPRPGRPLPSDLEVEQRLADHYEVVAPTLLQLCENYPRYNLDGNLPVQINAEKLLNICEMNSNL
jgi:adenylate kinase family enzyme